MWRGYDHGHARFAHQHASQAVNHRDSFNRKRPRDLAPDLGHHLEGHRLVTFVIEAESRASFSVVANRAFERYDRPFSPRLQARRYASRIDGMPGEAEIMSPSRRLHHRRPGGGAPAHRR